MNATGRLFIAVCMALGLTAVSAQAVLVTFDDLDATTTPSGTPNEPNRPGALTELTGDPGGIDISITRRSGGRFDIIDNAQQGNTKAPTDSDVVNGKWGARSLDTFISNTQTLIITFDTAVHTFSALLGDYGDDDDAVMIKAFSNSTASGAPLAIGTGDIFKAQTVPGGNFTEKRVTVYTGAANILSVEIYAGAGSGGDVLSVFIDRLFFSANPEPIGLDGEGFVFGIPDTKPEVDFMLTFLDIDNAAVGGSAFNTIPEPASVGAMLLSLMLVRPRRRV
ncbi:hypothetical protein HED60_00650 [Planctomycetales bacterium ZRK34]|nr:hypothetical protein HED60_00650 [Planctomycetales bacterium ZRK34]